MTERKVIEWCEVCGEPTVADYINGDIVIHGTLACKCERDVREAEKKEREEIHNEYTFGVRKYDCFGQANYENCTFENSDDNKIVRSCKKYAERFDVMKQYNVGLLLMGPVGTGKTFLAACIANKLLADGYRVKFVSFGEIERSLFDADSKQAEMNLLTKVDLLVIDDYGTQRDTSYMTELVTEVINTRHVSGKPMIVTTNLTDFGETDDLTENRLRSRITKTCYPIFMDGEDRRIEGAVEIYERARGLFDE